MSDLVLILEIAGRRAALRATDIQSVVELEGLVTVPHAPPFVLGLSALRSSTLTVIDAAAAMGLPPSDAQVEGGRAVVIDHCGHRYALIVDAIDDVAQAIGEPTQVAADAGMHWRRVSEGLLETDRGPALLIDASALLSGPTAMAA